MVSGAAPSILRVVGVAACSTPFRALRQASASDRGHGYDLTSRARRQPARMNLWFAYGAGYRGAAADAPPVLVFHRPKGTLLEFVLATDRAASQRRELGVCRTNWNALSRAFRE